MSDFTVAQANQTLADQFAPWVQALGLEFTVADKAGVTAILPVAEHLYRVGGIVSGQAMMAAADTAMVIGFSSFFGEFLPITTVEMSTSFLRPASTDITIRANEVKPGRSICFGEAVLSAAGKEVSRMTGTYMLVPVKA